jgi:nicotinate-nucleotide adenylyltransferase
MRLGIFGGSFDPVHNGHLALARACQEQAQLNEVWFIPTAVQPLKRQGPHATNSQRVEMLRLAIDDEPTWRVCTLETDRGGASYTVDTLRQLQQELPEASLFFLIGSDALRDVERWKEPREIFRLARPLVVHRAGEPAPDVGMLATICAADKQPQIIEMLPLDISSTEIRNKVSRNEAIDTFVPHTVAAYIVDGAVYSRGAVDK